MIKKVILGIIAIFMFVFAVANVTQAASTNTSARKSSVPHWDKKVVKVYVPQDPKSDSMRKAFSAWQNTSNGQLSFSYAPKDKADIVVSFIDKAEGLESPLGGYTVSTNGSKITKAEIKIATKSKAAKKYSNEYIYKTMLHEVGHVIGMSHNERKPSSIMYVPINEKQKGISKIDTINMYKVYDWSIAQRNFKN